MIILNKICLSEEFFHNFDILIHTLFKKSKFLAINACLKRYHNISITHCAYNLNFLKMLNGYTCKVYIEKYSLKFIDF